MAKLARLPAFDRPSEMAAGDEHVPRLRTRYYAFLSYSHRDSALAEWLHRELERFRVPHSLAGKLTANGVVPRRLTPVFRDQQDLSAGADLGEEIKAALAASQFLIVLCSPTAAKSRWTNQEIESFKRTRPEGCVLAAVVAGEPFASDMPGRADEECFPPALRFKYDRRGHQTSKRAEPLAADFREEGGGRRLAFLKLVAGMLGVGLDELVQREQTRRQRRLAYLAAASIAGMAVTSTLAVTAIQARDAARDQRREAEGLIGFMLGDLKDKLEPIGRLDALDGVGSRVLAYYHNQTISDLSDAALSQRSKALSLMAQVADARGDTDGAQRLYREAMVGTAEAIRRNPDDPERLFEQAQNVFEVGELSRKRGDFAAAEAAYRDYQRLAGRMVSLQPDNLKWRMEAEEAQANVGIALFNQRRFAEADRQFQNALSTIEAVVAVDASTEEYQQALTDALAWVADTKLAEGQLKQAAEQRQRQVALLQRLIAQSRGDVNFRRRIIPAYQGLGRLMLARGDTTSALQFLQSAVLEADRLVPSEPQNTSWQGLAAAARINLADATLASGDVAEAAQQTQLGCDGVQRLIARDHSIVAWRGSLRLCFTMRAQLALRSGSYDSAVASAQQALKLAGTERSVQSAAEIAKLHRLAGDAYNRTGKSDLARSEWSAGLAALPAGASQRPPELAESAALMQRLGMTAQSKSIADQLNTIGYRNIAWRNSEGA
jgi:tetratricopeptide (TPR) repeat protein